jgi:hypothetical protein
MLSRSVVETLSRFLFDINIQAQKLPWATFRLALQSQARSCRELYESSDEMVNL